MAQEKLPVAIEDEMRKSYLDYAMSVIIGRALPDIRDGLKPVHRRVIFAMHVLGNEYNKPYKKSARVVGDVIGKYHPHGDTAVYDAITRMVQDFSLRYPLVDGQGNFGSIDGDMPAAMRYTEVRMARLASELLKDIEKETVKFIATYDEQNTEPAVLPASYPNLLVNGSSGIAVGMATNMPPHNLTEIIDALIYIIKNPEADLKDIMKIVKGPDFPTGGFIQGKEGIQSAYKTGRGSVKMRGRVTTEMGKGKRESIIITEIPYMVNKARLIEKVADLVRDKKIEGISDIRDESDRDGMRIVLDLKKDEHAEVIINNLYKQTQLQSSFGIINLAIVDGQPKVLNLMELLNNFIGFRKEVVTKRTIFDLKKARERAHILEGLKIAVDRMDEVIKLIRSSKSPQLAKEGLIKRFKLSEIQSQAILDMRLHRLTALEQLKIMDEYKEIKKYIKELESILESEKLLMDIIVTELGEVKERYGDERRTEIVKKAEDISIEELITEEDMVVTITSSGYIKRNPTSLFKIQKRGGKGKSGMTTRDEDFVESLFIASTHSHILFFTDRGKAYALKVYDIPQAGRTAKGKAIVNILNISQGERLTAYLPVREFTEGKFVVMATQNGTMKKTDLMQFSHIRSGGIIAIGLEDGNNLISARLTDGTHEIFAATDTGTAIRFNEKDLREMGRSARGVKGINLKKGARVVGMETISGEATILTVTEKGYGKRTKLTDYRSQSRGGSGIINIKVTDKNGPVVGISIVHDSDEAMISTSKGKIIRIGIKDISVIGRSTQGIRLMGKLPAGEKVMGVALIAEKSDEDAIEEV